TFNFFICRIIHINTFVNYLISCWIIYNFFLRLWFLILYKHFQNTFTTPSDACCRSCGFVIDEWKPTQINVDEPDLKLSWKSKLKKLLLIGESHETKRSY